jgi:hypothetical protein
MRFRRLITLSIANIGFRQRTGRWLLVEFAKELYRTIILALILSITPSDSEIVKKHDPELVSEQLLNETYYYSGKFARLDYMLIKASRIIVLCGWITGLVMPIICVIFFGSLWLLGYGKPGNVGSTVYLLSGLAPLGLSIAIATGILLSWRWVLSTLLFFGLLLGINEMYVRWLVAFE